VVGGSKSVDAFGGYLWQRGSMTPFTGLNSGDQTEVFRSG
jgi:hypothetical protein